MHNDVMHNNVMHNNVMHNDAMHNNVMHNGIMVKRIITSIFRTQSLRSFGPKIWNNLPSNINSETSSPKFKG